MSCQGLEGRFTTSLCNLETYYSKDALVVWLLWGFFCLVLKWGILYFFYLSLLPLSLSLDTAGKSLDKPPFHFSLGLSQVLTHGYDFHSEAFCSSVWTVPVPSASPPMRMLWSLHHLSGSLLWFNPSHPPGPTQLLGHSPTSRICRELKVKVRKPMGWSQV